LLALTHDPEKACPIFDEGRIQVSLKDHAAKLVNELAARCYQPRIRDANRNRTKQEAQLIVVTTENVTGHRTVRMLGQCFGVVVRSRGLGGNIVAGLRSIIGGEIHEYTQMLEEARRHALDRLVQNASAMGANAIVMMRFDSAEIGNTMSEIVAYGTAAVIEPAP
jgi:uncharacterized protein YbjQ (UPF0145 family)